jgi:hypothetical protein
VSAVLSPPTLARHRTRLGVNSERMLGQSSQFFASATDAFAELIQNAYRAGASRVWVAANEKTREIVFRDNGRGCENFQDVLNLASSGWRPDQVVNAAGFGAFAVFALAETVTIRSFPADAPAWECTFGPEAFRGSEIVVNEIIRGLDGPITGFEVTATLDASVTFPALEEEATSAWRHFFPLHVSLITPTGQVELPARSPALPTDGDCEPVVLETAVGSFAFCQTMYHVVRHRDVIWEHRQAGDLIANEVVGVTSRTTPSTMDEAVLTLVAGYNMRWTVAPSSGVRPQLPDRHTLKRDQAFTDAMSVLRQAILAWADVPAILRQMAHHIGTRADVDIESVRKTVFPRTSPLYHVTLDPFLAQLGFVKVRDHGAAEDLSVYVVGYDTEDSSTDLSDSDTERWVRPAYQCAMPGMAYRAGVLASATAAGAPTLSLAWDAVRLSPTMGCVFAENLRFVTIDGATVASVAELHERGQAFSDTTCIALGLTPARVPEMTEDSQIVAVFNVDAVASVVRTLRDSAAFDGICQGIAHFAPLDDVLNWYQYVDGRGDDAELDNRRMVLDAIAYIANDFGGDDVVAAENAVRFAEVQDALDKIRERTHRVERALEAAEVGGLTRTQRRDVQAALDAIAKASKALRRTAGK